MTQLNTKEKCTLRDFIAERNEQYRKDTIKDNQFEIDADGTETKKDSIL